MAGYRHPQRKELSVPPTFLIALVFAVTLAFGLSTALGRLWGGRAADPPRLATTSPNESVPTHETQTPLPSPTADEAAQAAASTVGIEETDANLTLSPTATPSEFFEGPVTYGTSVNGYALRAYRLGRGPSARALIGGIHGGYEWNTTQLVSKTLATLQQDQGLIPSNVTLYIIPCANPDGAAAGTDVIHGRVNGNNVDLNRNWDYQHQMTATHGTRPVYAGDEPFSEPETRALRDFILDHDIEAAIFYHSAMGKIFSGAERDECATFELAEMMSDETGYPHALEGVPGQITTGDAIDYLSDEGITAIEIELTTHQDIDWDQNWRGVQAFVQWEIPATDGTFDIHVVQLNETISQIALDYGVTETDILQANDQILDPDQIDVGQVIRIPRESGD